MYLTTIGTFVYLEGNNFVGLSVSCLVDNAIGSGSTLAVLFNLHVSIHGIDVEAVDRREMDA